MQREPLLIPVYEFFLLNVKSDGKRLTDILPTARFHNESVAVWLPAIQHLFGDKVTWESNPIENDASDKKNSNIQKWVIWIGFKAKNCKHVKQTKKNTLKCDSVWKLSCTLIKTTAVEGTKKSLATRPASLLIFKAAFHHLGCFFSNSHELTFENSSFQSTFWYSRRKSRYADMRDVKRQQHFFAFRIECHARCCFNPQNGNDRNDLEIWQDFRAESTKLVSLA